ncbi:protein aveugle [Culicoides brevitarsis]|uniref:protein aveugle n=1 Tax=Culicoides brevitarsis TaxID=469753 RepID=UPI00307B23FD
MVEETAGTNKSNKSRARPRSVFLWTVSDVQKWFRRHCGDSGASGAAFPVEEYAKLFADNDITGRTLLRMTDDSLYRMGIHNNEHRNAIYYEVLKQKLKEDILTIRDLELKYRVYSNS